MSDPTPTPAPTPTPTPAPAPAPTPTPTPTPAPAWHGLADPADIQYIENKGWKSPADLYKSYRGVEAFVGRDPATLTALPKADDAAATRALLQKLGLPESADKYELGYTNTSNLDEGYVNWARETFHKVGMLPAQVKELTAAHEAFVSKQMEKQENDYKLNVEADRKELAREWGAGYERMVNAAKTAANNLGFPGEAFDAIEQAMGYGPAMKLFASLGKKMGEPGFVRSDSKTGGFTGTMTPEEAKAEWGAMAADPAIVAALKDKMHPRNAEYSEKQRKLFGIMYPNG